MGKIPVRIMSRDDFNRTLFGERGVDWVYLYEVRALDVYARSMCTLN